MMHTITVLGFPETNYLCAVKANQLVYTFVCKPAMFTLCFNKITSFENSDKDERDSKLKLC